MNLHINDNYKGQILKNRNCDDKTIASLNKIANKKLSDLANDNPNLLVFPNNLKDYKDKIGSDEIFGLKSDKTITTGNIMGFIGIDDVQLNIGSRFDENKEKQYFLQYIIFNKAGIKHAIYSRTYEMKIELIYKAAELLKSSTLYEIVKDKQNRPDIKNIYKFVSNYKKDEKDFFVYIIVRETKDGKFYYDHGIIKEKF